MGTRPLILSALVFVLLVGVTFGLLRLRGETPPVDFFALAREIPDTLVVVVPPDSTVLVPGGSAGWRVIHPVQDDADGLVVAAMLKRIRLLEVARRFPLDPAKMDTYGMRLYRGRIIARYRDGVPGDTLTIGAFTMNEGFDYVRDGTRDEVGLFDARDTRAFLLKGTRELRQIQLMRFHETRAVSFQLLQGGNRVPRVEVVRGDDGSWHILRPWEGPAERRRVLNYLAALNHMEILDFLDGMAPDSVECGLAPPVASAVVELQNGQTLRLDLGNPVAGRPEEIHARTSDRAQVVSVSDKYLPSLLYDANRLRDPVIIPFGLNDADSVVCERGGRVLWGRGSEAYRGPETRDLPLRGILEGWIRMRAEAFAPALPDTLRRYGLDEPRVALSWIGPGGTLLLRLEVGRAREGLRPIRGVAGAYARPGEVFLVDERRQGPLVEALVRDDL